MKMRQRRKQFRLGFYVTRSMRFGPYRRVRAGNIGFCRKLVHGMKGYWT